MMNLLLILISTLIIGAFIMISFIVGLHYGSKVKANQIIEPINPIKAIKTRKQEKVYREEQQKATDAFENELYNIDIYDGTEKGQKNIK